MWPQVSVKLSASQCPQQEHGILTGCPVWNGERLPPAATADTSAAVTGVLLLQCCRREGVRQTRQRRSSGAEESCWDLASLWTGEQEARSRGV